MRLDAYQVQLNNLFKMFSDITVNFEDLKAKLPAGRVNEEANFFDNMKENFEQVKQSIEDLKYLMQKDDEENTNEAEGYFFGSFREKLEAVRDGQKSFQDFLGEKDFDELSIPGMKEVYSVFMAANSGLGLCHNVDALNKMDKVSTAKYEFEQANKKYKDLKNQLVEKYKGIDVEKSFTEVFVLKSNLRKKEIFELPELKSKQNGMEKEKDDINNDIEKINSKITDTEVKVNKQNKTIKSLEAFQDKLNEAETQYLGAKEQIEEETASKRAALVELENIQSKNGAEYFSSVAKLNQQLSNSEIGSYVESQMKLAEYNILLQFLNDEYEDEKEITTYNDLNPEAKAIIDKHLEIGGDKNPTVAEIFNSVTVKMAELASGYDMTEHNESVMAAVQEFTERALQVLKTEKAIAQVNKEIDNDALRIQNNKEAYDNKVKEHYEAFRTAGIFGENTKGMAKFNKIKPEEFKNYLTDVITSFNDTVNKNIIKKDTLEKKKNELNNKKADLEKEMNNNLDTMKKYEDDISKLQTKLDKMQGVADDLETFRKAYNTNRKKLQEAVTAYGESKASVVKGELESLKDAATKLYDRVGDAAKGHTNSTEFEHLRISLEELKDAEPVDRADKIAKLQQVKLMAEKYKKAKLEQHRLFASTLRKTRLQFADDVIAAAKERLESLTQFDDKELEELETLFGVNSKNMEKLQKDTKQSNDLAKGLTKKTMAEPLQKQEAAPTQVNETEIEEEMSHGLQ